MGWILFLVEGLLLDDGSAGGLDDEAGPCPCEGVAGSLVLVRFLLALVMWSMAGWLQLVGLSDKTPVPGLCVGSFFWGTSSMAGALCMAALLEVLLEALPDLGLPGVLIAGFSCLASSLFRRDGLSLFWLSVAALQEKAC